MRGTSYGTYVSARRGRRNTIEGEIADTLGEYEDQYDVEGIADAIRHVINRLLEGTGITLHGHQFYGPAEPTDAQRVQMRKVIAAAELADPVTLTDTECVDVAVELAWGCFWDLAETYSKGEEVGR